MCKRTPEKLRSHTAGSITVEYTVLMVLVAVSCSAAIYAIGMPLVERYRFMKLLIALPLP